MSVKSNALRKTTRRISQEAQEWEEQADPEGDAEPELDWGFMEDAMDDTSRKNKPGPFTKLFIFCFQPQNIEQFGTPVAPFQP